MAYLLFVILFGAWVRITHSGAGCGRHWPLCNGEVLPSSPSVETIIEFTHRSTSGLCGLLVIGLLVWAVRRFGTRSPITATVVGTLLFVVFEGAIGAGLVLGELVEDDASLARAIVISLHLTNTLLLMACASATAWLSSGEGLHRPSAGFLGAGAALVATAMTGAVTALGDTIFPVGSDAAHSAAEHFLVQLRIVHPILAATVAVGLMHVGATARARLPGRGRTAATVMLVAVAVQLLVGPLNIVLAAPGWMQLLHLLVAQVLWIGFVLTAVAPRSV